MDNGISCDVSMIAACDLAVRGLDERKEQKERPHHHLAPVDLTNSTLRVTIIIIASLATALGSGYDVLCGPVADMGAIF